MILPHGTGPGLSALSDEPALAIGRQDTPSYRRWVDRFLTRRAARSKTPVATAAVGGVGRRIRLTAPASGTLFRLP
jgi:hypothetical protein